MVNKTKRDSRTIPESLVNHIIPQNDNKVNGKIKLISNPKLNILNTITKEFKSQKDFKFYLAEKITDYKKDLLLINGDNKFKPARPVDVFNVIKNYIPLKYIKNISKSKHISYEFYIQDYDDSYGLYKPLQLENLISKIAIYYEIPNIIQTIKDVSIRLNNVDPEDTIFGPLNLPLKQRLFTERLKVLLNNFGFKLSDKQTRLTALSLLEFNLEFINEHYMNNQLKDFNKRTKFNYILTDKNINEDDLNNFKLHEKLSVDDLSTKELIMLDYLIQQGNTEAILLKNCN